MFTYNGLTMAEMLPIHRYYEAACTAEYVMENWNITDEEQALKIGYAVRELMDKYGYSEEEAIEVWLKKGK